MNYSEKAIQNKIIKDLKDRGYWVMKTQGGVAGTPIGAPDIIACGENGKFTAIEVKKIGGKLSEEQVNQLKKISNSGGSVYVTNDKDFAKKLDEYIQPLHWPTYYFKDDYIPKFNDVKTLCYVGGVLYLPYGETAI